MAMTVFDLEAVLKLNSNDYEAGLNQAETKAQGFGGVAKKALGGMATATVAALATATTATVAFGKESVEVGQTFDKSMSQVAATMGKTMQEMEQEVGSTTVMLNGEMKEFNGTMRDFAQFMGANTAFSASQAADALNYMALAGYNTQQSMDMLPNVLNLAAAGGMDLARASDMVTDSQTALGLSFAETNVLVDQMAKTASTTNTSVEQLGDAILTIGGTAQFMAGGTEELNAVLGILADNGIKGSEAGTHLRNMILKLSAPTDQGAAAIEELGLSVYDAEGKMRSFEDIFTDLNNAMADFTEEQKVQTFSDLFNTRDVASATALLNTTVERWGEVKTAIDNAEGSASQMAETQLDNLAGDITIFKSALEGLQITLSDQLTPTLREFVQFGTSGIQQITEGFQEGGLAGAMTSLGNILSEGISKAIAEAPNIINAALSLIESVANALKDNAPMIISAIFQIATMVLEKLPQILQIAIQIVLALAQGIAEAVPNLIPVVLDVLMQLIDIILDNINLIIDVAGQIITALVEGILSNMDLISYAIYEIEWKLIAVALSMIPELAKVTLEISFAIMRGLWTGLSKMLTVEFWLKCLGSIVDAFAGIDWLGLGKGVLDTILEGWKWELDFLDNILVNIVNAVRDFFENTGAGGMISGLVDSIKSHVSDFLDAIREFFQPAIDFIINIWNGFMDIFGPLIQAFAYLYETIFLAIGIIVKNVMNLVKSIIEAYWNLVVAFWTPILEKLKETVETAFNFIREKIITPLQEVWEKVVEVWNNVWAKIVEVTEIIKSVVSEAFQIVYDTIAEKLEPVLSKVKEIWDGVKDKIMEVVSGAKNWGKDLIDNFISGLKENISNLADAVTSVADVIRERLHFSEPDKGPLADFDTYAPDMMATFARGIAENENLITDQIQKSFNFGDMIAGGMAGVTFAGAGGGDIIIPVSIGNEMIQTIVVDALNIANYRSGGR